ncbi:YHS domain-containing (seleno)protein [Flavobacterium sp. GB2R13]|uniref:YHS domain-containing (seleno)protein n=1 Tax=Flavobacterium algoris TaxID=3398733 RepID=UPI003A864F93
MKSKIHEHQKNSFKLVSKKQILYLFVIFISLTTIAQTENSRLTYFNLEHKVALQGYDPVAYFKQGKAVKGKKELTATYEGVSYNFSMPVNREYFLKNPSRYEPQFGGWCAYAMGDSGEKVEINPQTFKIVDEKLYLFYNAYFNNTLKSWNKDQVNLKSKAESNWKKTIK